MMDKFTDQAKRFWQDSIAAAYISFKFILNKYLNVNDVLSCFWE